MLIQRLIVLLLMCSNPIVSVALDKERLWLPVKYQGLYLSLVHAAETAEMVDRCTTVIEGTLDLEQSTSEHPIYRILCRQDNGWTYNEMVDGLTFATLTTPDVDADELASALLREQKEVARQREAWQICRDLMVERTRLMMGLNWLVGISDHREPDFISADEVSFVIPFDARGMSDERLHYAAQCTFQEGIAEVSLRKRQVGFMSRDER